MNAVRRMPLRNSRDKPEGRKQSEGNKRNPEPKPSTMAINTISIVIKNLFLNKFNPGMKTVNYKFKTRAHILNGIKTGISSHTSITDIPTGSISRLVTHVVVSGARSGVLASESVVLVVSHFDRHQSVLFVRKLHFGLGFPRCLAVHVKLGRRL